MTQFSSSCKDYDDDIDQINTELAGLASQLAALQTKVDAGKYVTNVAKSGDGIVVTWSDGGSSTIETIKGDKGDAVEITIDPTTKNWLIDGEDTGVCAEGKTGDVVNGVSAKSPSISTETGNWVVYEWNAETSKYDAKDTGISARGASTYVLDKGAYWEMHVATDEKGTATTTVKLPKTASINSIKAVTIANDLMSDGANLNLVYGQALGADVKFNDVTYAKGTILLSKTASFSAVVNPLDADATVYSYVLADSKGNAPLAITNVAANKTDNALTRAATVNKGVYDMTVQYANTAKCGKLKGNTVYSLTTETANGIMSSEYNVKVANEAQVNSAAIEPIDLNKNINEELDLMGTFETGFTALSGNSDVANANLQAKDVVVAAYFTIADETKATACGVTLSGNTIKATKAGTVPVNVHYLLVDGTKAEGTSAQEINVTFNYVAPSSTLADVEWTITNAEDKNVVYLPLGNLQTSLVGATDNQIPTINQIGWSWIDDTALADKKVTINGTEYAASAGTQAAIDLTNLYVIKDGKYQTTTAAGAKIQDPMYIQFTFTPATAFPGEYKVKLGLKKGGNSGDNDFVVPVKVTIKEPSKDVTALKRLDAYFVGNDAVAYGTANGTAVTYDLFDLYKDMGTEKNYVTFTETKHADHTGCVDWITATGGNNISLGLYSYTSGADNRDKVYSTRAIKASYKVFNNPYITTMTDEFNLTIKSEIAEGSIEAAAAANKTGKVKEVMKISLKDIVAKDVYGKAYNLADVYSSSTDKDGKTTWAKAAGMDSRVASVTVSLADDNANNYLEIVDQDTNTNDIQAITHNGKEAYSYFQIVTNAKTNVLTQTTACKVNITVLDKWGMKSTTSVTVTLEPTTK